ncbi:hypothetical protein GOV10_01070 [Candidatus Woesearchaeota archaeon]|nr:hypothetical protein [Candidatus Woesearchaeota archaeon]
MAANKMNTSSIFFATNRKEWRAWLKKNHAKEKEVWLVYYKKHTDKLSVTYRESLEEALCFGWIDGIKRSLSEEEYTHRFTPRREKSKWSPRNIKLAQEMIKKADDKSRADQIQ